MLSCVLPGLADIDVRKPQVSSSNLEVGSRKCRQWDRCARGGGALAAALARLAFEPHEPLEKVFAQLVDFLMHVVNL